MANRNVFRGIAAYLTEHARTAKGEFSLDGIVVTHPDHDHIDGILELRIFPPNTDPEPGDDRAKLDFHGPLLITKYFERVEDGRELIKIVGGKSGFGRATVDNPSNAGFGSNFEFHFLEDPNGAYSGLTFTTPKKESYYIHFHCYYRNTQLE